MLDVVSDVLRAVRLSGIVVFRTEFSAPWSIVTPAACDVGSLLALGSRRLIPFHAVAEGECITRVGDGQPTALRQGDVVMYPKGDAHLLASDAAMPPTPVLPLLAREPEDRLHVVSLGGGGATTKLVCGFVHCDDAVFNPLAGALPAILCGRSTRSGALATTLDAIVAVVLEEASGVRAGRDALLTRLTEVLFVEVLRRHMETLPPEESGWLAGLRDPFVGRALRLLHAEPARDWTVESLARAAGLSRSGLVERFGALVGQPPMAYLTHWRIQLATRLLRDGRDGVASVAESVGYASEAAFNRAFKRILGRPPAAWRRSLTVEPPAR